MNTSRLALGFLGAACLLAAVPAHAQRSLAPARPTEPTAAAPAKQAPPPALPGSRAETIPVAPASKAALDLPPTDALFDAVNRGDVAAAKDALNRGADLNGHNVLGLTPLDLAIDLGRNEITFVLLSMRGTDSQGPSPQVAAAAPAGGKAQRTAARSGAERPSVRVRPARYASPAAAPATVQAPRRFAGDGGTPNPSAGFLGFNATR